MTHAHTNTHKQEEEAIVYAPFISIVGPLSCGSFDCCQPCKQRTKRLLLLLLWNNTPRWVLSPHLTLHSHGHLTMDSSLMCPYHKGRRRRKWNILMIEMLWINNGWLLHLTPSTCGEQAVLGCNRTGDRSHLKADTGVPVRELGDQIRFCSSSRKEGSDLLEVHTGSTEFKIHRLIRYY